MSNSLNDRVLPYRRMRLWPRLAQHRAAMWRGVTMGGRALVFPGIAGESGRRPRVASVDGFGRLAHWAATMQGVGLNPLRVPECVMSDYRGPAPTTAFLTTFRKLLRDQTFRVAAGFLAAMIASGTVVYMLVEEWSPLDSLYFSVITASTVGFGDFAPDTDIGKAYTIVYVLVTTGLLLLVLGRVATEMIANRVETPRPAPDTDEKHGDADRSSPKLPS